MRVVAPQDFGYVTPLDRAVDEGEVVEVDAELGETLVAQGWKRAGKPKSNTEPTKGPAAPTPDATPPASKED